MRPIFLLLILVAQASLCTAQNVGIGTNTPNPAAKLEIQSANSGLLIPRLGTAQVNAIVSPPSGLLVYDNNKNLFSYYNGTIWNNIKPVSSSDSIWSSYTTNNEVHVYNAKGVHSYIEGLQMLPTGSAGTIDGVLRIGNGYEAPVTINDFLTMDGKGIQARTKLNNSAPLLDNYLLLNRYGGNVGIGIANPSRAKLELNGAGLGTTSAIFGGDGAGLSLQKDWPVVGFNQYFDFNGFTPRYIGNGYAAAAGVNQTNGDFFIDIYGNGSTNNAVTGYQNIFNIKQSGRVGIGTISPVSRLQVTSGELLYSGISGTGRGYTTDTVYISGIPHTRYTHERALYAAATDKAVALEINGPVAVGANNNEFVFQFFAQHTSPSDVGYYEYLGNGYWAINLTGNGSPLNESTFPTLGYIYVTPMFSWTLNDPGGFNIPTRGMLWYSSNSAKFIVDTEPVQVLKSVIQLRVMVIRKNPDVTF